jgi:hypothetical protein
MRYLVRHGVFSALAIMYLAGAFSMTTGGCVAGEAKGAGPANVLACRLANYGRFEDAGWAHLPSIGIKHVFINTPPPAKIQVTMKRLAEHGLKVVVLRGQADLSQPSCIDELALQLETCEKMGVKYMFLSPKRQGIDKQGTVHGEIAFFRGKRAFTCDSRPFFVRISTLDRLYWAKIEVFYPVNGYASRSSTDSCGKRATSPGNTA